MRIKPYLILLFVAGLMCKTEAQTKNEISFQHKIGVTIMFEHINLPFTKRLGEKRHVGLMINYSFAKERDKLHQIEHNFNLGYFKHKNFFQATFINYKPSFGLRLGKVVSLKIPLGVGLAYSTTTQQGYKHVDGTFVKSRPTGKIHFMPSLGLGASLNLCNTSGIPIEIFTQYEVFSLAPYAPYGSLPFTVHTSTNFGLKYRLR